MSTAALLKPRPYQRETIDAIYGAWKEGIQRPAVVLPTGSGKTIILSHLISEFIQDHRQRVVVLVHRDELADQSIKKLRDVAPHLSVGKVKAASNEVHADVMVCSVQTLARGTRVQQLGKGIGLVIADEVHHYASKTYHKVLTDLGCFTEGGTKLAGFTATLSRGDGVGLGHVVDEVVYSKTLMWMISKGYLVKPEGRLIVSQDLDLSTVKKSSGDYQSGDLGRALEEAGLAERLPLIYKEHAGERQGIVFTPTVATATQVADCFTGAGIPAAMVCGETPRSERLAIFDAYRRGRIRVMANAMVLTEGFDMPQAEVAVIARPTQSNPLYCQMVGRVLRPFPGKEGALILDVVGSTVENKLRTLVDLEEGMFVEVRPCTTCEQIPCACSCDNCGKIKRSCTCPKQIQEFRALTEGTSGTVDLFSGSAHSWLSTNKGVMFIPAGDAEVFLWVNHEGTFDVGLWQKGQKTIRLHQGLPLGTAMAWAETEAEERTDFNAKRSASWRKTKASPQQIDLARRLKIEFPENIRKGELGNMISVAMASRHLDGLFAPQ